MGDKTLKWAPPPLPGRRKVRPCELFETVGNVIRSVVEKKCSACGRPVRATIDGGRCGVCAVRFEYAERAEAGTLSFADRSAGPGRAAVGVTAECFT